MTLAFLLCYEQPTQHHQFGPRPYTKRDPSATLHAALDPISLLTSLCHLSRVGASLATVPFLFFILVQPLPLNSISGFRFFFKKIGHLNKNKREGKECVHNWEECVYNCRNGKTDRTLVWKLMCMYIYKGMDSFFIFLLSLSFSACRCFQSENGDRVACICIGHDGWDERTVADGKECDSLV